MVDRSRPERRFEVRLQDVMLLVRTNLCTHTKIGIKRGAGGCLLEI